MCVYHHSHFHILFFSISCTYSLWPSSCNYFSLSLLHYQYDIISSDLVAISPLSFSFLSPCLLYIPILHLIQRCHLLLYRSASFSHVRTLFYLFPSLSFSLKNLSTLFLALSAFPPPHSSACKLYHLFIQLYLLYN